MSLTDGNNFSEIHYQKSVEKIIHNYENCIVYVEECLKKGKLPSIGSSDLSDQRQFLGHIQIDWKEIVHELRKDYPDFCIEYVRIDGDYGEYRSIDFKHIKDKTGDHCCRCHCFFGLKWCRLKRKVRRFLRRFK